MAGPGRVRGISANLWQPPIMQTLLPVLMIGLFVGVFALTIAFAIRQQKRGRENLVRLAQTLGLPVPESSRGFFSRMSAPTISGTFKGRPLRLFTYTTGSGKHRVAWCALAVTVLNPGGLTLKVGRENLLTRAGRIFGVEDISTGDTTFDEQFYLKSNDAGYTRAAFIREVRLQFIEVWKNGARGAVQVDGADVKYAEQGSFSSDKTCARFPAMADLACMVADVVEARGR